MLTNNNKLIEQYIQFAIDNWYDLKINFPISSIFIEEDSDLIYYNWYNKISKRTWRELCEPEWIIILPITKTITSKEFIKAIARWIRKNSKSKKVESYKWIIIQYYIDTYIIDETDLIEWITTQQAIAIRDNKLDLFIKKILWI